MTGRTITSLATLPEKALIDQTALAEALMVSKRTIRRMVNDGKLPPPMLFGGRSTWIVGNVLSHIEANAKKLAREAEATARRLGV